MEAKEVLSYLFGRLKDVKPVVLEVGRQTYAVKADGTLGDPVRELAPHFVKPTLSVATLEGLAEAHKAKLDDIPDEVAFHIESPTSVALVSLQADPWARRHVWARATHRQESLFSFGKFYSSEDFIILFRASFMFEENAVQIQRLLSTLSAENSVSVSDDGLSQVVTVKEGTVSRTAVELPPEIPLIFWRTFRDATPVVSKFMLRLKGVKDSVPLVALFEIDAKWQLDTMNSIADALRGYAPGVKILA